jgi:hypothetical protein
MNLHTALYLIGIAFFYLWINTAEISISLRFFLLGGLTFLFGIFVNLFREESG